MKTAAIIVDDWKVSIFRRYLEAGGYTYTESSDEVLKVVILRVQTEDVTVLLPTVEAAASECAKLRDVEVPIRKNYQS